MLISTALLLDSIIRNSVCTPAKLPGGGGIRIIIILITEMGVSNEAKNVIPALNQKYNYFYIKCVK
jgi:hypothetical protein